MKYNVEWRVVEDEGNGMRPVADGKVVKEAASARALYDELEPLLRSTFPDTGYANREYVINITEAEAA